MRTWFQGATAVVAVIALGLTIFHLYLDYGRVKNALFFARIFNPSTFMNQPQFALVNGGNKDVLITSIMCCFATRDGKGSSYPSQELVILNGSKEQMLIEPGKAVQYWIKMPKKFPEGFHLEGELQNYLGGIYIRQMNVDIHWVDVNGNSHHAIAPFQLTGFTNADESPLSQDLPDQPVRKSINLYDESVHKGKNIFS